MKTHIVKFLEFKFFKIADYEFSVYQLLMLIGLFLATKFLLWLIKKTMLKQWRFKKLDKGSEVALFQLIKYVVWVIAITIALDTFGVKITLLIAGSAALLVGVGLGLQQTFNDIVSGIILLLEGSIKVGDVIEVDDIVVRVREIGLRTSKVINRDDIIIILPNSKIVTDKVINWSHQVRETRFRIAVGVAYESDIDTVIRVLEESAREHPECSKANNPIGRLVEFGDSSLNFELIFWSERMFRIEQILSDIRRTIARNFKENNIVIPFPQRDLHFKSGSVPVK